MASTVVALSAAVLQLTHDGLLSELRRDVRQRASELSAVVGPNLLTGFGQSRVLDVFSQLDVYCQVVYPDGTLAASGPNLDGLRLPFRASSATLESERIVGKIPLILVQQPVIEPGTTAIAGYAIVGRSPASTYQAMSRLRSVLYPAAAIALAFGGLAGWLLVRRAIRPLDRVGRAAAAIAASGDHGRRVAYHHGDEIGRLAAVIDEMLGSLDAAHRELEAGHAELESAHRELASSLDALETSHAAQRQFLLDVSHELRTPLTIMLSSLDVIARTGVDDPAYLADTLRELRAETDRMRRMVGALLIMARSEAEAPLAREPVLLADAVAGACREVRTNGSRLVVDEDSLARVDDVLVQADPGYLRQVLLILLDNAVKYTPDGGTITVAAEGAEGAAGAAETAAITVRDTGIGIPPDELPLVFDRFYRGSNARGPEGSGLGLAIARHIAALHGGRIDVTSEIGRGSAFTLRLPVLTPDLAGATG